MLHLADAAIPSVGRSFDMDTEEVLQYSRGHPDSRDAVMIANHKKKIKDLPALESNHLETYTFALAREPAARCLS